MLNYPNQDKISPDVEVLSRILKDETLQHYLVESESASLTITVIVYSQLKKAWTASLVRDRFMVDFQRHDCDLHLETAKVRSVVREIAEIVKEKIDEISQTNTLPVQFDLYVGVYNFEIADVRFHPARELFKMKKEC